MLRNRRLGPDGAPGGGTGQDDSQLEERLSAAELAAASAVERYRALVAAGPDLVPEMVQGSTIEAIDASVETARKAYTDIRRKVAEQYEREVPPGNPSRSSAAAGAEYLKPEAKIALGLRRIER
jgi:hypothetical protein